MRTYRLYFTDERDLVVGYYPFVCAGDREAVKWATSHAYGRPMELWCEGRRVTAFTQFRDNATRQA